LDGIGNYNGLVFVATTNYIDKLDPALYRDMRLSRVFFDYTRKEDLVKLFEKFYGSLTAKQIARLPTRENKIAPSSVIALLERNLSLSVDSTIDKLLKMCKK
jgi:chaperone BCS1